MDVGRHVENMSYIYLVDGEILELHFKLTQMYAGSTCRVQYLLHCPHLSTYLDYNFRASCDRHCSVLLCLSAATKHVTRDRIRNLSFSFIYVVVIRWIRKTNIYQHLPPMGPILFR